MDGSLWMLNQRAAIQAVSKVAVPDKCHSSDKGCFTPGQQFRAQHSWYVEHSYLPGQGKIPKDYCTMTLQAGAIDRVCVLWSVLAFYCLWCVSWTPVTKNYFYLLIYLFNLI